MSTSRNFDWREVVEKNDGPERHRDSLYPEAYRFAQIKPKRDTGPNSGIYEGTGT